MVKADARPRVNQKLGIEEPEVKKEADPQARARRLRYLHAM